MSDQALPLCVCQLLELLDAKAHVCWNEIPAVLRSDAWRIAYNRGLIATNAGVWGPAAVRHEPYRQALNMPFWLTESGKDALALHRARESEKHAATEAAHKAGVETQEQGEETNAPARLTVDLARKTITLDGRSYDVRSDNALRWVRVLAEHPKEWISSADLKMHDPELQDSRTDRWRKHLPEAILRLIDSETGKGSRLRVQP
jgi:hypothetical protein